MNATDSLTGLYDRSSLATRLHEELARARRYGVRLSLMLLDVDALSQVNDRYGEVSGAALLRAVAQTLQRSKRESDVLARIEGGQFAIVLYDASAANATSLASRIMAYLDSVELPCAASYSVSLSIGIAEIIAHAQLELSADTLLERAYWALQRAKAQGPGSMVLYVDPPSADSAAAVL